MEARALIARAFIDAPLCRNPAAPCVCGRRPERTGRDQANSTRPPCPDVPLSSASEGRSYRVANQDGRTSLAYAHPNGPGLF